MADPKGIFSPNLVKFVGDNYVVVPDMEDDNYLEIMEVLKLYRKLTGEGWDPVTGFSYVMHDFRGLGIRAIGYRVSLMPKSNEAIKHHRPRPSSPEKKDDSKKDKDDNEPDKDDGPAKKKLKLKQNPDQMPIQCPTS